MVRDKPRLAEGLQSVGSILQQMFAGMTAAEALAHTVREAAMRQDEPFPQHFDPPADRTRISNAFLDAIRRDGAKTAREVVDNVLGHALEWRRWPSTRTVGELTIATIGEFEREALAYAAASLEYLKLTKTEQLRRKWDRGKQHARPHMVGKDTTPEQHGLLLALGYSEVEIPTDMAEASDLIEAAKQAREAAHR